MKWSLTLLIFFTLSFLGGLQSDLAAGQYGVQVWGYVLQDGNPGAPLKFVEVLAKFPFHGGTEVKATTDELGRFSLIIPHPGKWYFGFSRLDYQPKPWNSNLAPQVDFYPNQNGSQFQIQTTTLTGTLGEIWGYAEKANHIPLANADVKLDGIHHSFTDFRGHFSILRLVPGWHTVSVTPSGFSEKLQNVMVEPNVTSHIRYLFIEAPPVIYPAIITGQFVYPPEIIDFMKLIKGFTRMKVQIPTAPQANIQQRFDESGFFEIKNLYASQTHQLIFATPGFTQDPGNTSTITLNPGTNLFPDVKVDPIYTRVKGTILTSNGSLATSGDVILVELQRKALIDGSGTFSFETVPTQFVLKLVVTTLIASGTGIVIERAKATFLPTIVPETVLVPLVTQPDKPPATPSNSREVTQAIWEEILSLKAQRPFSGDSEGTRISPRDIQYKIQLLESLLKISINSPAEGSPRDEIDENNRENGVEGVYLPEENFTLPENAFLREKIEKFFHLHKISPNRY